MRRFAILFACLVVTVACVMAREAAASSSGKALVELESHINWSAVDGAWRNLRDNWVRTTAACDEPACVAAQMLKLEENVKWKAVDSAWRDRRTSWLNDCRGAMTERTVTKLLLEFESNVRWRAVDAQWKTRRESWMAELNGD